jgi:hypothetical protein
MFPSAISVHAFVEEEAESSLVVVGVHGSRLAKGILEDLRQSRIHLGGIDRDKVAVDHGNRRKARSDEDEDLDGDEYENAVGVEALASAFIGIQVDQRRRTHRVG